MKVLLVDSAISGHRLPYIKNIYDSLSEVNISAIRILPEKVLNGITIAEDILQFPEKRNFLQYLFSRIEWLSQIFKKANHIDVNIVHILSGDSVYQLGGFGIKRGKVKLFVTQHHVPQGKMRRFAFKRFCKKVSILFVHSKYIKEELVNIGVSEKIIHIVDYPVFHASTIETQDNAKNILSIPQNTKVLLALGGTRRGKGLDILLDALRTVKQPFLLIIAGKEEDITDKEIETRTESYIEKVRTELRFLTDEEFGLFIDASDYLVLPYRKSFAGASGPMTEAIWRHKLVIGPKHGMIGRLIEDYSLGYTFESENIQDLAETIEKALTQDQTVQPGNDKFGIFRHKLSVDSFKKSYQSVYLQFMQSEGLN